MNISGLHYYKWVLFILQRFRYLLMLNNKKKTLISLKPSLVLISLPSVELVRIIQDHWKNGHLVKYLHWIVVSDIFRFFFLIFGLSSRFTLLCFSEGWHVETTQPVSMPSWALVSVNGESQKDIQGHRRVHFPPGSLSGHAYWRSLFL